MGGCLFGKGIIGADMVYICSCVGGKLSQSDDVGYKTGGPGTGSRMHGKKLETVTRALFFRECLYSRGVFSTRPTSTRC